MYGTLSYYLTCGGLFGIPTLIAVGFDIRATRRANRERRARLNREAASCKHCRFTVK
jgi:hypothetical protein